MWLSLAGGIALVVVILTLAFDRSMLARELGEKEEECEHLKRNLSVAQDTIALRIAADPTLEQLDGMYEASTDVVS
jgi:hypothetical protein